MVLSLDFYIVIFNNDFRSRFFFFSFFFLFLVFLGKDLEKRGTGFVLLDLISFGILC